MAEADAELPPEIDDLFRGPPGEFIAARDALAKSLKADKQPEAAKAVKALRRPTLAAWGVNQLAHHDRDELAALFELTAELSAAQDRAVRGRGEPDALRTLGQRHRQELGALADRAAAHLDELGGSGTAQRDEVVTVLERATTDPAVHALVVAGRLSTVPEADPSSGFGGLLAPEVLASMPDRAEPTSRTAKQAKAKPKAVPKPKAEPSSNVVPIRADDTPAEDPALLEAVAAAEADLADTQAQLEQATAGRIAAEAAADAAEQAFEDARAALDTTRLAHRDASDAAIRARRDEREARAAAGKAERVLERRRTDAGTIGER